MHSVVGLAVRFEQPSLEIQSDIQVIYNFVISFDFDGKSKLLVHLKKQQLVSWNQTKCILRDYSTLLEKCK